jgi:hypothetical protein
MQWFVLTTCTLDGTQWIRVLCGVFVELCKPSDIKVWKPSPLSGRKLVQKLRVMDNEVVVVQAHILGSHEINAIHNLSERDFFISSRSATNKVTIKTSHLDY